MKEIDTKEIYDNSAQLNYKLHLKNENMRRRI